MDKVSIAIKTCDRRPRGGKNYLGQTLKNLERGGVLSSPHLNRTIFIVDSGHGVRDPYARYDEDIDGHILEYIDIWPVEDGSHRTLHQTAQLAIELTANRLVGVRADYSAWCLVLEDDIDVCADFLESVVLWLNRHHSPSHLMYAFGANYDQIRTVYNRGDDYWLYPVNAFYGAQALAWKRSDAAQLAEWLGPNPSKGGVTTNGHDLLLQDWGKSRGVTHFLASAPSFVQHIGDQSSIGNRFFQFSSFQGRDWTYNPDNYRRRQAVGGLL